MTRDEALELLSMKPDAGTDAIRARVRELYSEYEVRLTNAPTTSLRLTYQRNIDELEDAGRVLLGTDASLDELKDLPIADPIFDGRPAAVTRGSSKLNPRARTMRSTQSESGPVPKRTSAWLLSAVVVIGAGLLWLYRPQQSAPSGMTERLEGTNSQTGGGKTQTGGGQTQTGNGAQPTAGGTGQPTSVSGRATPVNPTERIANTPSADDGLVSTASRRPINDSVPNYGPYRFGMSNAEVRAIARSSGRFDIPAFWKDSMAPGVLITVPLKIGSNLPDDDVLRPFMLHCKLSEYPPPVLSHFSFTGGDRLASIEFDFNQKCPGVDRLVSDLIAAYGLKPDTKYPNGLHSAFNVSVTHFKGIGPPSLKFERILFN